LFPWCKEQNICLLNQINSVNNACSGSDHDAADDKTRLTDNCKNTNNMHILIYCNASLHTDEITHDNKSDILITKKTPHLSAICNTHKNIKEPQKYRELNIQKLQKVKLHW
jgi:hypothetical protein